MFTRDMCTEFKREGDKEKTMFSISQNFINFIHIPFRLHGTTATFQGLMVRMLKPVASHEFPAPGSRHVLWSVGHMPPRNVCAGWGTRAW